MVAYASNESRQCPPPPSNETSSFMKDVETFVLYQSSLALIEFVFGYIFVMCLNYVAENQVMLRFLIILFQLIVFFCSA